MMTIAVLLHVAGMNYGDIFHNHNRKLASRKASYPELYPKVTQNSTRCDVSFTVSIEKKVK